MSCIRSSLCIFARIGGVAAPLRSPPQSLRCGRESRRVRSSSSVFSRAGYLFHEKNGLSGGDGAVGTILRSAGHDPANELTCRLAMLNRPVIS